MVRIRVRGFVRIIIILQAQKTISHLCYLMLTDADPNGKVHVIVTS